jgi:hypothetical protein
VAEDQLLTLLQEMLLVDLIAVDSSVSQPHDSLAELAKAR